MTKKKIYVTSPSLAKLDDFKSILEGVWESGILTHNGPMLQQFESEMISKLSLPSFVAVSNGTIAIQTAIKALDLEGEIITTAFSWIASISAIKWQNCKPVFVDIDPNSLNIDINDIEKKINNKTVAIMPVHVFGNACDVEAIENIAKKHNIKVIYDAAHAVGSKFAGKSLLQFGDISATSLHATKILNTAEGGGCVSENKEIVERLKKVRFFGYDENKEIVTDGFNAKMSEIHAALGLANIKYFDDVLIDRKIKYKKYKDELSKINGINFQELKFGEPNFSYFPVIFETEADLVEVYNNLKENNIYARRYFYPSVNTFKNILPYREVPISENISQRILCLPLYRDLDTEIIIKICEIITNTLKNKY